MSNEKQRSSSSEESFVDNNAIDLLVNSINTTDNIDMSQKTVFVTEANKLKNSDDKISENKFYDLRDRFDDARGVSRLPRPSRSLAEWRAVSDAIESLARKTEATRIEGNTARIAAPASSAAAAWDTRAATAMSTVREATKSISEVKKVEARNIVRTAADAINDLKNSTETYKSQLSLLADDTNLPSRIGEDRAYSGADLVKVINRFAGTDTKLSNLVKDLTGRNFGENPAVNAEIAKQFNATLSERTNTVSYITALWESNWVGKATPLALSLSLDTMQRYYTRLFNDETWKANAVKNAASNSGIGEYLKSMGLGLLLEASKLPVYVSYSGDRIKASTDVEGAVKVNATNSPTAELTPFVWVGLRWVDAGVSGKLNFGKDSRVEALSNEAKSTTKLFEYVFDLKTATVKPNWLSSLPEAIKSNPIASQRLQELVNQFNGLVKANPLTTSTSSDQIDWVRKGALGMLLKSVTENAVNQRATGLEQGMQATSLQLGLHISVLRLLMSSMIGPLAFVTVGGKATGLTSTLSKEKSQFLSLQSEVLGDQADSQKLVDYLNGGSKGAMKIDWNKGWKLNFDPAKINLSEYTITPANIATVDLNGNSLSILWSPKLIIDTTEKTINIRSFIAVGTEVETKGNSVTKEATNNDRMYSADLSKEQTIVAKNIISHYNRAGLRTDTQHIRALVALEAWSSTAWSEFMKVRWVSNRIWKVSFNPAEQEALLQQIKNETAGYLLSRNFPVSTGNDIEDKKKLQLFLAKYNDQLERFAPAARKEIRKGNYGVLMLALETRQYADGNKMTSAQNNAAEVLGVDKTQYAAFRKSILEGVTTRTVQKDSSIVRAQLFTQRNWSQGLDINDRASEILQGSQVKLEAKGSTKFMYDRANEAFLNSPRSQQMIILSMQKLLGWQNFDQNLISSSNIRDVFAGNPIKVNGSTITFSKELSYAMFNVCANDEVALTKLSMSVETPGSKTVSYSVEDPTGDIVTPSDIPLAWVLGTGLSSLALGVGAVVAARSAAQPAPTPAPVGPGKPPTGGTTLPGWVPTTPGAAPVAPPTPSIVPTPAIVPSVTPSAVPVAIPTPSARPTPGARPGASSI